MIVDREMALELASSEASLSFLGFGLPPDVPSWGAMLSREGRRYMQQGPWLALWPGLCLTIVVYSLNMFGDAVRDLLDPRLRGGGAVWAPAAPSSRSFANGLIEPSSGSELLHRPLGCNESMVAPVSTNASPNCPYLPPPPPRLDPV